MYPRQYRAPVRNRVRLRCMSIEEQLATVLGGVDSEGDNGINRGV